MQRKHCFGTLYKYELLKILKNKVALVTFLVIFFYSFIQGEFEVRGNIDPAVLDEYAAINGREIDDGLIGELLEVTDDVGNIADDRDIAYDNLAEWVSNVIGTGTSFKDITVEKIYEKRSDMINEAQDMAFLTEEERQLWDAKEASVKKPFVYHDTVISAGILEGTSNYGIMMLMIIAISLSSIFAMETQRRTDPMIRAAINGTKELYFAKVLAGMSYILCCLIILLTGFISYIGIVWGFEGLDSSIITYHPFTSLNLTIAELERILVILVFLGTCLISSFALFVSNVSRNSLATMAIVIGTYLVMFILSTGVPYRFRVISQFLSLLPSTLISSRLVYEFRLVRLGKNFLSYQAAPVLYIILTVIFIWMGYILYKRHEIKSN